MSEEPTMITPASLDSPSDNVQPQYEFSPVQNKVFGELAGNLRFAGWFIIFVIVAFHAVLIGRWAIQGVPMYEKFRLSYVLWPLLLVYCSWQFIATAKAFREVVETQGSDITHLMDGLDRLNRAFIWLTLVPKVWVIIAIIGLVVGAVIGVIHLLGY